MKIPASPRGASLSTSWEFTFCAGMTIIMYVLSLIVALIPLFFSHIFSSFGIFFMEGSSFERVKVYLFCILIIIAVIETLFFRYEKLMKITKIQYSFFFLILIFPLLVQLFRGWGMDPDFLWGSHEKHHGYYFFTGLVFLFGIATLLEKREYDRILRISLITASIVACFAVLEYMKLYSFFPMRLIETSWEGGRANSTLGNPNYVAGYLVMLLPLITLIRKPERYSLLLLLILGILTTQSFIGISIMIVYWVYLFMKKSQYPILYLSLCIVLSWSLLYFLIPPEKLLSLMSRWVLMIEVLRAFLSNSWGILFGYGPDSIIGYFSFSPRSDLINAYFPAGSAIDSSHNILIDILYSYGIIFFVGIVHIIRNRWNRISRTAHESIILAIVFFSLNVVVISPLIPLIILLAYVPVPSRSTSLSD